MYTEFFEETIENDGSWSVIKINGCEVAYICNITGTLVINKHYYTQSKDTCEEALVLELYGRGMRND